MTATHADRFFLSFALLCWTAVPAWAGDGFISPSLVPAAVEAPNGAITVADAPCASTSSAA